MTTVLIAYPGVDVPAVTPRIEAVASGVRVLACAYETSHDVRTLRDEDPFSAQIPAVMPALTEEQRRAFAAADVALALDVPLDLPVHAPRLQWVQNVGSGSSRYRSAGLAEGGILLTNAAGISADGIAEFVLARLLEHWKRLPEIARRQRAHEWGFTFGQRAAGKTVVVVGMGAIGRQTARLCGALGMRVIGVVRTARPADTDVEYVGSEQMPGALAQADAVVLAATDTAANEDLFDEAAFAAMPPGSFFVNVSRGRLVDDAALAAALASGHLAAAATDVARVEPVPADSPLWETPNLRLSPHSASTQDGYVDRVVGLFCENLDRFLRGERLHNLVPLTPVEAQGSGTA
jgi:phosphoglycerate dehydrogenase-like enzyme